jgi:hypothetical protein
MDQEIQHIVTLSAHLQTDLNPIQHSGLEELCGFERAEEVPFLQRFWSTMLQGIENETFQQFLV